MIRLHTLFALALLVPSVSLAGPITITSTNGLWSGALPNSGPVIANSGTPRTIRWGAPGVSGQQSGYDYLPTAPFAAIVDGAAFLLGSFTHHNFTIGEPFLTSVNLDFSLDWVSFAPDLAGAFAFTHHETPNGADPCAYGGENGQGVNTAGCADKVTIGSLFLNTLINNGTDTYFFTLFGFSTDGGNTASHQYITREGQTNTAGLYARVTSVPIPDENQSSPVPEPTIFVLFGSGLAGLCYRWKRRSR